MTYIVRTKRGYYEERKSVREGKKVRSVFVRFLGKFYGVPDISFSSVFETDHGAAAAERAMEEANAKAVVEEDTRELFSQEKFLEETTSPTSEEPNVLSEVSTPSHSQEASPPAEPEASEPQQPDAPAGSEDASGS